jgi:O-antigen ligase/polysaccharide polymerase Wzy-like membrane protein
MALAVQAGAPARKYGSAGWLDSLPTQAKYYAIECFVFLFVINLPLYLYLTGIWNLRPQLLYLVGLLFVPFARVAYSSAFVFLPFAGWNMLFLLTVASSALMNADSNGTVPGTYRYLGGTVVSFLAVAIGATLPPNRLLRTVCFATVVTSLICLFDLIFPFALPKNDGEFLILGRAAGLYIQPNGAGMAISLGFLMSHSVVGRGRFYLFFFICMVGLLATASRGALLCFVPVLFFVKFPGVRFSTMATLILVVVLLAGLATASYESWSEFQDNADLWLNLVGGRSFGIEGDIVDPSGSDRIAAAAKAWEVFSESPWLGAGVGYTRSWDLIDPPHNMYLTFAAEFGGLVGIPLLILYFISVYFSIADPRLKYNARLVLQFLALFFFFTHNHFDDYVALLITGALVGTSLRFIGYPKGARTSYERG